MEHKIAAANDRFLFCSCGEHWDIANGHIPDYRIKEHLGTREPAPSQAPTQTKPSPALHNFTARAFDHDKNGPLVCKDYGTKTKGCGQPITMDVDETGKWHPYNLDGTRHTHTTGAGGATTSS